MEATTRVTASAFQNSFGVLSDKARTQPVVITKHGHDSLVVLSVAEWQRLKRRARHVGLTSEAPDDWIEAVRGGPSPTEYTADDVAPK